MTEQVALLTEARRSHRVELQLANGLRKGRISPLAYAYRRASTVGRPNLIFSLLVPLLDLLRGPGSRQHP